MNVLRPLSTSLGGKAVVAVTGLLLVGFVLGHMAGNLLIFLGRDWLNSYAHHLKSLGVFLWVIRAGLLAVFVLHLALALKLTLTNSAARPVPYAYEDTMQASWASRHMWLTGLLLLAFIAYHLAHFTAGATQKADVQIDAHGTEHKVDKHFLELADWHGEGRRHDVYSMVVNGFRNPYVSVSYLVAMAFLGLHLWHGASSLFQTLGLNSRPWGKCVSAVGPAVALIVVAGNCAIVLAVWLRVIGR